LSICEGLSNADQLGSARAHRTNRRCQLGRQCHCALSVESSLQFYGDAQGRLRSSVLTIAASGTVRLTAQCDMRCSSSIPKDCSVASAWSVGMRLRRSVRWQSVAIGLAASRRGQRNARSARSAKPCVEILGNASSAQSRFLMRSPSGAARHGEVNEGQFCSRACQARAQRIYPNDRVRKRAQKQRARLRRQLLEGIEAGKDHTNQCSERNP